MKLALYPLFLLALLSSCTKDGGSDTPSPGSGTGGSTARFTISGNNLYVVTNTALQVYDIAGSSNPKPGIKTQVGFGVETIFPYQNNLFIGTQMGMYIYGLAQPGNPQWVGFYSHIQSCDPVVVQGKYAYVTLRSGTPCRNTAVNSLDVVDISNLASPKLVGSYPMKNPHGLGADSSLLFVGEGDYGLRVLDISNPLSIRELQYFDSTKAYDVIPNRKRLLVTGPDGIYQYNYANQSQLKLLSKLPVEP